MTQRRPNSGPPDIIIHSSLAQNLQSRFSTSSGLGVETNTETHIEAASAADSGNTSRSGTPSITATSITRQRQQQRQHAVATASASASAASRSRALSSGAAASAAAATQVGSTRDMVWVDSKERLSEMATSIRGMSKALSNVALAVNVKNVLIISKLSDEELAPLTRKMVDWLLHWKPHPPKRSESPSPEYGTDLESDLGDSSSIASSEEHGAIFLEKKPCSSGELHVYVQEELANKPGFALDELSHYERERLFLWNPEKTSPSAEKIDLVVTLGGDGTVLYTSWLFQKMVPPTLSFGLGSLGFMTENSFDEFEEILDNNLTNGICCALRMRFSCTVMRTRNTHKTGSDDLMREMREGGRNSSFSSHTREGDYTILNEVVVDRGPNPFVTMTELYGNFELLTSIKADGVVISTPTGSTAYSMSAGGGLVHPDIPAQLISPICPHTLSFRPLVVPDSMALHIGVPYDARSSAFVSFDGKARVELRRGDFLAINVSRYPFPKVLPERSTSISWVQQLSRTLHWNEQKRPKRYTDGKTDNWH